MRRTVSVDVEVDLNDISTEDLMAELASRGKQDAKALSTKAMIAMLLKAYDKLPNMPNDEKVVDMIEHIDEYDLLTDLERRRKKLRDAHALEMTEMLERIVAKYEERREEFKKELNLGEDDIIEEATGEIFRDFRQLLNRNAKWL